MMPVKFKRMHPDASLPKYGKPGDNGLDLKIVQIGSVSASKRRHWYGLAVEIPPGYVGKIYCRSSVHEYSERLTNAVGIVDSNFRGEISCVFDIKHNSKTYQVGDRSAQLIIERCDPVEPEWAEELSETERGELGYGSSGA